MTAIRRRRLALLDPGNGQSEPVLDGTPKVTRDAGVENVPARHLCPTCPSQGVVPAGTNDGNAYRYCCTARKTLTTSLKRTLTKYKTRTITVAPVGRVANEAWLLALTQSHPPSLLESQAPPSTEASRP